AAIALLSDELVFRPLFRRAATSLHLLVASIGVGLIVRYALSLLVAPYDFLVVTPRIGKDLIRLPGGEALAVAGAPVPNLPGDSGDGFGNPFVAVRGFEPGRLHLVLGHGRRRLHRRVRGEPGNQRAPRWVRRLVLVPTDDRPRHHRPRVPDSPARDHGTHNRRTRRPNPEAPRGAATDA